MREQGEKIALVILDMTMPVMSGEETFRHMIKIAPRLPVLASTGYTRGEAAERFTGKQVVGFLQKPYTPAQLASSVKAALQRSELSGEAAG